MVVPWLGLSTTTVKGPGCSTLGGEIKIPQGTQWGHKKNPKNLPSMDIPWKTVSMPWNIKALRIYLGVVGLCCCTRAFSSCGAQASH